MSLRLFADFGVQGIPHVAIIGPDGKVAYNGLHPAGDKAEKIEKDTRELSRLRYKAMDEYIIRIRKGVRRHRFTLVQKANPRSVFNRKRHVLHAIMNSATLTDAQKESQFKVHYGAGPSVSLPLGRAGEPNLNLVAA